jgi:hypothetical protein
MRKIKSKERQNGMRYCTFCKPLKVDAKWRNQYRKIDQKIQLACEEHKHEIVDGDKPGLAGERVPDSGRITEADYQSWNNSNVFF